MLWIVIHNRIDSNKQQRGETVARVKAVSDLTESNIEDFIRQNYDEIYKYCYWKIRSPLDAEDLTQETFLRFVKNLDSYTDKGKPKALLYTIAKNLCINKSRQKTLLSLDAAENIKSESKTEEIENRVMLEQYLCTLSKEQQEILLLRYGQDLQINEIADITELSRFTVMYRIKTALSALNKKMKEDAQIEKKY